MLVQGLCGTHQASEFTVAIGSACSDCRDCAVLCEGEPCTPAQLEKKKILEHVLPDMFSKAGLATYKGIPLITSAGPCTCPTLQDGASLS